jgi:SAM-dependent methyltransferase
MPTDSYYQSDLAWVHHAGYAQHVETVGPGIVRLLRDAGLGSGARVLDVGCGSGLLARTLRADGFAVLGVDASAAMIELARRYEPSVRRRVAPRRLGGTEWHQSQDDPNTTSAELKRMCGRWHRAILPRPDEVIEIGILQRKKFNLPMAATGQDEPSRHVRVGGSFRRKRASPPPHVGVTQQSAVRPARKIPRDLTGRELIGEI